MASFINAINRKEYQRAYAYWETPPVASFAQFEQGYADTAAAQLIISAPPQVEGAAGSVYASVPTVLLATHTDGSQHLFTGCYIARRSNLSNNGGDPQNNPWSLYRATVATAPGNADVATRLAQACAPSGSTEANPLYDNTHTPVAVLAAYYNAVNRREYQRAYAYRQNPPNNYNDFAQGYADTTGVQLIIQPPTRIDAGAGNLYVQIPAVLIARHQDGSEHAFSGCYVVHKSNLHPPDIPQEDTWHISRATIAPVTGAVAIPALLAQGCAIQ